jgi:hypothetical protein
MAERIVVTMTDAILPEPPKPGIRGALVFVLLYLVLRSALIFYLGYVTIVGDQENPGIWFTLMNSETMGFTHNMKAYLWFALFETFVNVFLPSFCIYIFIKKWRSFTKIFTLVIMAEFFLAGIDALFANIFFGQGLSYSGPSAGTGLLVSIGIIQYMRTSLRARVTFVN